MTSIITNEIEERYPYPDNGERPTVYESGKRIADRELEWWKQVAVSAWGFINGTEKEQ